MNRMPFVDARLPWPDACNRRPIKTCPGRAGTVFSSRRPANTGRGGEPIVRITKSNTACRSGCPVSRYRGLGRCRSIRTLACRCSCSKLNGVFCLWHVVVVVRAPAAAAVQPAAANAGRAAVAVRVVRGVSLASGRSCRSRASRAGAPAIPADQRAVRQRVGGHESPSLQPGRTADASCKLLSPRRSSSRVLQLHFSGRP